MLIFKSLQKLEEKGYSINIIEKLDNQFNDAFHSKENLINVSTISEIFNMSFDEAVCLLIECYNMGLVKFVYMFKCPICNKYTERAYSLIRLVELSICEKCKIDIPTDNETTFVGFEVLNN